MNGVVERLALGVQRQAARADGEVASEEEVRDGLRVTLSELGKVRAAAAKNNDIDEADLPDNIKEILKMIRELRQQIAEKQAELQALMAESDMDPEAKQMRLEMLRGELASLQGALSTAQASLVEALKDKRLSNDQRMQATSLAMA
jgi:Sec-independent protein translocase protein TatA